MKNLKIECFVVIVCISSTPTGPQPPTLAADMYIHIYCTPAYVCTGGHLRM